jgi:hypothetical protein
MTENDALCDKAHNVWGPAGCLGLTLLLTCGVPVGFLGWLDVAGRQDWAATEEYVGGLQRSVEQAVPPGSDRKAVEAWLASQGLGPGRLADSWDEAAKGHGIPPDQLGDILVGSAFVQRRFGADFVRVYFFLDRRGKVIRHLVHHERVSL